VHDEPIMKHRAPQQQVERRLGRGGGGNQPQQPQQQPADSKAHAGTHAITEDVKHALAQIAASTIPHTEHKPATDAAPAASAEEAASSAAEPARTAEAPAATDAVPATAEASPSGRESQPSSGGRRRGRHRRVSQDQGPAETQAPAAPARADSAPAESRTTEPAPAGSEAAEASEPRVSLDLPPVAPAERRRTVRAAEAEVLLDSVLDALPAPKKAGEGRSRSRRVSTAALSTAGGPPVITRADGTTAGEHQE